MAHDFLGNELSIGDDVVFLNYNVSSASLERGKITRVSEHTAEISGKRRAEYKIIKVNPVKPTMDNTWIPCSERLPEKNGVYLVAYIATGTVDRLHFCTQYGTGLQSKKNVWVGVIYPCYGSCGFETIYDNVTHWMPMPEPPEEGGTEK